jgi:Fe-S-cluster containining protein
VTETGCGIYDERPLICRLYGTTEASGLQCPHGRAPAKKLSIAETNQIWREYAKLGLEEDKAHRVAWALGLREGESVEDF